MAEPKTVKAYENGEMNQNVGEKYDFKEQLNMQRVRNKAENQMVAPEKVPRKEPPVAQRLKAELLDQLKRDVDESFNHFLSDVDHTDSHLENGHASFSNVSKSISKAKKEYHKSREKGELPDKVFTTRRSVLTDLFEIDHIKTIYHMFAAIFIVFSLNTLVYDIIDTGTLNLNFELIKCGLGKLPKVMYLWVLMMGSTLVVVYPGFYYWATNRTPGHFRLMDWLALCIYVIYQITFLVWPVIYVYDNALPAGSAVIITTEQLRLMMKTHAFVRENSTRVLGYKKSDDSHGDTLCPDFSKYLYFLFAPTLVYRDTYPRTATIRWNYVVSNFGQTIACLFYTYYIFERFCVPVFRNFNHEHVTPKKLLLSAFGCMMPGTLVLFIAFFAILHSWLNAFAEMLRFGDRLFYSDWWNSTSFSNYYRTWNIVVHDWLYTYVYKDCYKLLGSRNRTIPMTLVFLMSAVFHEYVLIVSFNFFYPVLFVMFMGAGFAFMFLNKGVSRGWNIFLWVSLFIGNGLLMCLYSMEWYARQNCPVTNDNFLDYVIPRSWFCGN